MPVIGRRTSLPPELEALLAQLTAPGGAAMSPSMRAVQASKLARLPKGYAKQFPAMAQAIKGGPGPLPKPMANMNMRGESAPDGLRQLLESIGMKTRRGAPMGPPTNPFETALNQGTQGMGNIMEGVGGQIASGLGRGAKIGAKVGIPAGLLAYMASGSGEESPEGPQGPGFEEPPMMPSHGGPPEMLPSQGPQDMMNRIQSPLRKRRPSFSSLIPQGEGLSMEQLLSQDGPTPENPLAMLEEKGIGQLGQMPGMTEAPETDPQMAALSPKKRNPLMRAIMALGKAF